MRLACIAVGSNAIRMLSAEWDGETLRGVVRERRGTRLFAGLVDGRLTEESMRRSADAVSELAELAGRSGAQRLFLFATSAARDAENAADFAGRCREACGLSPEILTGEEEAVLSFLGACTPGRSAVIDIGGGSTEFTLGEEGRPQRAQSLQMGAVRFTRQEAIVGEDGYDRAYSRALELVRSQASGLLGEGRGRTWTGVGGTMTTLGSMQRRVPYFTDACEGMRMSREEVGAWGRKLARLPLEERRQVEGLMPHRADIIPAGIAILDAAMTAFGADEIRLSAQGNMDGYLKKKFWEMG